MTLAKTCLFSVLLVPILTVNLSAQAKPADQSPQITQILMLNTAGNPPYAVEALMALRSALPTPASALVDESTSSITIKGTGAQIELARKIVGDLEAAPPFATQHSESVALPTAETKVVNVGVATFEQTFYLGDLSPDDKLKVVTTVRQKTSSHNKVFLVFSLNALVVRVSDPDELDLVKTTIKEVLPTWSPDGHSSELFTEQPFNTKTQPITEQAFYLRSGEPNSGKSKTLTDIRNTMLYNEIVSTLRNMLTPTTRVFIVPSKHTAILVATQEELRLTQKIMNDLDKPAMRHPHANSNHQRPPQTAKNVSQSNK